MYVNSPHYERCFNVLRASPYFSTLSEEELSGIIVLFNYEVAVKKDARIEIAGPDQRFYIMLWGRAKVSTFNPNTGREVILELLTTGDAFDVFSLFDGKSRDVRVTALDDVEFMTTSLENVRGWIDRTPGLNRPVLRYLGEQMRDYAEYAEDVSLFDTETRLARLILRHMASTSPTRGLHVINDLSQETLAAMIGSVRVVVAQHFQAWRAEGILTTQKRRWDVIDIDGLIAKAKGPYRLNAEGHVTRL